MCVPGNAGGTASLATQAAGVGMSTVGAFFSAQAERDALNHSARMAEINAKIADSNARAEIERGNWAQRQIKMAASRMKSAQTARYAANGVDIAGSTTAQAVMTGTDVVSEVDANQARANAIRAAFGQRIEAGNQRRAAASMRASAKGISPGMAALTSLISGAGKVASSWYAMDKEGAFATSAARRASVEVGSAPALVAPAPNEPTATMSGVGPFKRAPSVYDFEDLEASTLKWAW